MELFQSNEAEDLDPPLHLIGTIPLAVILFYIAYLPLQIKDKFKQK